MQAPARTEAIGNWDGRRLAEVVQKLLTNAVKYSPKGGRIELRLDADKTSATVRVSDTGKGMTAEEARHVFERYYRGRDLQGLEGTGLRGLEGTGLGLYICHAIITGHGGHMWAESAGPGHGSTFGFTLPRRR
jgi:signal transduction histidine kinase